jgi:hypothetical protein
LKRSGATGVGDALAGCGGLVYIQNADRRALRREFQSNRLTNAASAAGDHGDLAIEPEIRRADLLDGHSETPRFHGMKSS